MRISTALGLGLLASMLPLRALAQADDYPNRPLRMVLPFPPGGSTDRIGRLVADKMSVGLKQPVVVDYRPGAGIRVSPHFYSTDDECDHAVAEIRSILESGAWRAHEAKRTVVT